MVWATGKTLRVEDTACIINGDSGCVYGIARESNE
jgi:hypothetical protein